MKHATEQDFDEVWDYFVENRKLFPHIRTDKVKRQIKDGQVILDDGVLITYQIQNQNRKIGRDTTVRVSKGDCVLHQIVVRPKGQGLGERGLTSFFHFINTSVFLTVRRNNEPAGRLYSKVGMKRVGDISWGEGKILGDVYCWSKDGNLSSLLKL